VWTWQENAVGIGELVEQVAGGVACTCNARHLQDSAAAQLVEHQGRIKLVRALRVVWLDAPHKVEVCPAQLPGNPWLLTVHIKSHS
jgi:hypothetical protein